MREGLFRGKRLDNGKWVYGFYVLDCRKNQHMIFFNKVSGAINAGNKPGQDDYDLEICEVDPGTVGQYTGLEDKKGVKIFKGDIVEEDGEKSVVSWIKEVAAYAFVHVEVYPDIPFLALFEEYGTDTFFRNDVPGIYVEVIGTEYDNPELLEVE